MRPSLPDLSGYPADHLGHRNFLLPLLHDRFRDISETLAGLLPEKQVVAGERRRLPGIFRPGRAAGKQRNSGKYKYSHCALTVSAPGAPGCTLYVKTGRVKTGKLQ